MSQILEAKIQLRHDTLATWASVNPVLSAGEIGVETDTGKLKVGNGTDHWNTLDYGTGLNGTDGKEVQLRVDGDYLQWKYDTDISWTNLLDLSGLSGGGLAPWEVKTASFVAVIGGRYAVNIAAGGTVTCPDGMVAGEEFTLLDAAGIWADHPVTILLAVTDGLAHTKINSQTDPFVCNVPAIVTVVAVNSSIGVTVR